MKAYEDIESKVTVEFTKTLVGRGIDLGRMKITREEKEDIIVRSLLVKTDEAAFDIMLNEALKMFDEKEEMKEFKRYFEQTYSKQSEVWAYCHRKWYAINTNIHIESMHRTIKYVYLQGKKVKRFDKTLFSLMKFVRDRVFDQLISVEVSSKISQLRKRHKVGQSLTSLCVQNNEEWSVSSTRDEEMIICEDRNILQKEAHVDNLRATSNTDRNFQGRIPERMHATNT
ncbi:uncharacterized protein TNCV_4493361 [Trichonephila clavipes]|uniref:Uncharacterized protein n=1 Tax=Trichonephila clavipes TaxID=2585209 RepID=A0A8X6VNL0_TRICX|nr:uncharacterized protein TNCV_4493361 [Trichonephila clavipes]